MKENTEWIVQFGSTDDPFLPFEDEQQQVANETQAEFHKYNNRGHFIQPTFPEIVQLIMKKIKT